MRIAALLLLCGAGLWAQNASSAQNSCLDCHSSLEGNLAQPATLYANDVHSTNGFTCVDCHGGDATQMDPELAMSPARGFRGHIARTAVPELCARCHSDATIIHNFKPQQRIDQLAQYRTSVHGKRLAAGDTKVAECVDCHSVHDIREVRDPLSPVYPTRLPDTCARCHANAEHMAGYGIPTDQFSKYQKSVHWAALSEGGDLSAPNCATCHGNHGATPPQVDSVAQVCGTCHVMQENLYKASPHQPVFEAMGLAGCVTCHGNHDIEHPTTGLLVGNNAVCNQCHEPGSAGADTARRMGDLIVGLSRDLDQADQLLEQARQSGMEVSDAVLHQHDARESLVKAEVAVHALRVDAVAAPVKEGQVVAAESLAAGQAALRERSVRRIGLGLSLITILITMAGLWLAIRWIEGKREGNSPGGTGGA